MGTLKKSIGLLLMCISLSTFAQKDEYVSLMLFPEFEPATIVYKDGSTKEVKLDYNTYLEVMCVLNTDGEIVPLEDPANVQQIMAGKRRFAYVSKNAFYERIPLGSGSLYIQWKTKLLSRKNTGYGYSTSTASSGIGYLNSRGGLPLQSSEMYEGKDEHAFYLKDEKSRYKRINSVKSLTKLFKDHENQIGEYAKQHAIDFKKPDDVAKIVWYCFSL